MALSFPVNRWAAFGTHLLFSFLALCVLSAYLYLIWYPGALFSGAGGWQGIRIVAGVDLIVGPLLTLIVFNLAKPRAELIRDLSLIGLLQLSCICAGLYVVYGERPAAAIYIYDRFVVVKEKDFRSVEGLADEFQVRPFYALIEDVDNPVRLMHEGMMSALNHRPVIELQSERYVPLPDAAEALHQLFSQGEAEEIELNVGDSDCISVSMESAYGEGTACFNLRTKTLVGFMGTL